VRRFCQTTPAPTRCRRRIGSVCRRPPQHARGQEKGHEKASGTWWFRRLDRTLASAPFPAMREAPWHWGSPRGLSGTSSQMGENGKPPPQSYWREPTPATCNFAGRSCIRTDPYLSAEATLPWETLPAETTSKRIRLPHLFYCQIRRDFLFASPKMWERSGVLTTVLTKQ
jgi:hypothetical protein